MTKNIDKLEIRPNGNFNNIGLTEMGNEDVIVIEKVYDLVRRSPKTKTYKNADGTDKISNYTSVQVIAMYKDKKVSFFLNGGKDETGKQVSADDAADAFDALGPTGTKVQITCSKVMGKDRKGKDAVFTNFSFAKV